MLFASLSPQASPLSPQQVQELQQLVVQLHPVQQAWVSGYLAASALSSTTAASPVAAPAAVQAAELTILYGSQTGNAKGLAAKLRAAAESRGLVARTHDLAAYKASALAKERAVVIVTSTYGEGDPPEGAVSFHKFLFGKKAPRLDGLQFAVLGLGDSSYEFFCKTATDFDSQLAALGGKRLHEPALLDVDYADGARAWQAKALDALMPVLQASGASSAQVIAWPGTHAHVSQPNLHDKHNPATAELSASLKITARNSTKDVRHLEISLAGTGLSYQPGDALGVYFRNSPDLVAAVLKATSLTGSENIEVAGKSMSVHTALSNELELTQAYPSLVQQYAQITHNDVLGAVAADREVLRAYLEDRQAADVIIQNPAALSAQQLVGCLRRQQPRLYSIASSQAEVGEEVHLTVGVVRYDAFGSLHMGGASGFLAERLAEGEPLRVFVEHNDNFRLPEHDKPIIMIGPGTGIAPFRAFLQERDHAEAPGKSWLFFGNPHFTRDFLYQVELLDYLKRGILSRLDVAFSRDQEQKVYVQHKLAAQGAEIWAWLQEGAYLYICGDGKRMAKDVHEALHSIAMKHGSLSAEQATDFLEDLRANRRIQKDVY